MRNLLIIKILLYPFSVVYGGITAFRNYLYNKGVFRSTKFDFPVISVGNMSAGGTGKTPHILFLAEHLKEYIRVGVLSRGYGRKTRGYIDVTVNSTADQVGDEPLLFKWKMPDIAVVVCEERVYGIPQLLIDYPDRQTILLDDAFQHRAVTPNYNILLTEYNNPYYKDMMLPSGNLREYSKGAKRADCIIVTKCPEFIKTEDAEKTKDKLNLLPNQKVFFSYMSYGSIYPLLKAKPITNFDKNLSVVLLCGIAKPKYIIDYIKPKVKDIQSYIVKDHHNYSKSDIRRLYTLFKGINNKNKIIVTTEKDAVRLAPLTDLILENNLTIAVLPIEVKFHFEQQKDFLGEITAFLQNFEV